MHSAIYRGTVWHHRHRPARHRFQYQVFMMYLDLAEVDQVLARSVFWSRRRLAPARFNPADYLSGASASLHNGSDDLANVVRDKVQQSAGFTPAGPIRLLTNLRYFGYLINPISCFYCFSTLGDLDALLIEVTNTPWTERTCYVLDLRGRELQQGVEFGKAMHVSPFMPMQMTYRWRGSLPAEHLQYTLSLSSSQNSDAVNDEVPRGEAKAFDAGVNFQRIEITGANLNRTLIRYPLMTVKVVSAIYLEALRLYVKRVPFVPHPGAARE